MADIFEMSISPGSAEYLKRLAVVLNGADYRRVFDTGIIPELLHDLNIRFSNEGYGEWPPNSPEYLKRKEREFRAGKINSTDLYQRTLRLFYSLVDRDSEDSATQIVSNTRAIIGTDVPYAVYLKNLIGFSNEALNKVDRLVLAETERMMNAA